jgi:hypothetical protein
MPKTATPTAVMPSLPQSSTTVRVTLPDALLASLEADARTYARSLDAVLVDRLKPTLGFPLADRLLVVDGPTRRRLEELLGPLSSTKALVAAVEKCVSWSLEGVSLTLEPWQLEEIARTAEREGITRQEALATRVRTVRELAFHGLSR